MRWLWCSSAVLLWACPGEFHFRDDGGTTGCPAAGCPFSLVCSATLQRCVECTADATCQAPRARCDTPRGRCVECLASSDCDAGSVCDADKTGRCVATCVGDAGCALGRCQQLAIGRVCNACYNEDVCERMPVVRKCDDAVGLCVRCSENAHCAAPTPNCDRRTGTCVECIDSRDCSGGTYCAWGSCRAQ